MEQRKLNSKLKMADYKKKYGLNQEQPSQQAKLDDISQDQQEEADTPEASVQRHKNIPLVSTPQNIPLKIRNIPIVTQSNHNRQNNVNHIDSQKLIGLKALKTPQSARVINTYTKSPMVLTLTDDQWSDLPRAHSPMVDLSQSLYDNEKWNQKDAADLDKQSSFDESCVASDNQSSIDYHASTTLNSLSYIAMDAPVMTK